MTIEIGCIKYSDSVCQIFGHNIVDCEPSNYDERTFESQLLSSCTIYSTDITQLDCSMDNVRMNQGVIGINLTIKEITTAQLKSDLILSEYSMHTYIRIHIQHLKYIFGIYKTNFAAH